MQPNLPPRAKAVSEAELAGIWSTMVLRPEIENDLLNDIRLFNRAGDVPPDLLLCGPPGCGKSDATRRIVESVGARCISLYGFDLRRFDFVGQAALRVENIWAQARALTRCVLLVDECESAFPIRGGEDADYRTDEIVAAFLAGWHGNRDRSVWVIAVTDRPQLLDSAVLARFKMVEFKLPGAEERLQILGFEVQKHGKNMQIPAFVGHVTHGFSGRDLAAVALEVCGLAERQGSEPNEAMLREVLDRRGKSR